MPGTSSAEVRRDQLPQGHIADAQDAPVDSGAGSGAGTGTGSGGTGPGWRGAALPALLRNTWRSLTSMRTALILLFLLALASLPGALLPQWSLNAANTRGYIEARPFWGRLLNRLGFFDVFASPWYAAIYLLLFISLVGCLLPRSFEFARQLRAKPVATPRNLGRLPLSAGYRVDGRAPAELAEQVAAALRGRRWRTAVRQEADGAASISAEKGFLREVGNLVFHFSLVGLLVAVAVGKIFGYEGSVIVPVGQGFCNASPIVYDNFRPGLSVDGTDLAPFCVQIKDFQAQYADNGQALEFHTDIDYQTPGSGQDDVWRPARVMVNDPLRVAGDRLYLLGHGYAPEVSITFPNGSKRVLSAPFISSDPMLLSQGTIKVLDPPGVPSAELGKHQLAITGLFAPTAALNGAIMTSVYPAATRPGLAVDVYRGDLGMEDGTPQSVFAIDQRQVDDGKLVKLSRKNFAVGDSLTLDDGTVITFTGYREWVSMQTSHDPAQLAALISAVLLLTGLMASLIVKRRRVWFRFTPADGGTVVEVGGLARTDQAGYGAEFERISELARERSASPAGTGKQEGT